MAATAPVETKVAAGSAAGMVTGVITWILVSYVPAFHHGLPPALASFLPYIVGMVLSTAAAYLAPHTARTDQVVGEAVAALKSAGVSLP